MPLIQISHAMQQCVEKKQDLVKAITQTYAQFTGSEEAKVWVVIDEVPRDNWGTGGTLLASRDKQSKG